MERWCPTAAPRLPHRPRRHARRCRPVPPSPRRGRARHPRPQRRRRTRNVPSGNFHANSAWLQCAVLAHNLIRWTTIIGNARVDNQLIVTRTIRTRLLALPGRIVNRAGRPTLRLPVNWPWAATFITTLDTLRRPAPRTRLTSALRSGAPHHPASADNLDRTTSASPRPQPEPKRRSVAPRECPTRCPMSRVRTRESTATSASGSADLQGFIGSQSAVRYRSSESAHERSWRRTRRFVLGDAVDRQCVERGEHVRCGKLAIVELAMAEAVARASAFVGVVSSSRSLGLAHGPHPRGAAKAIRGFWSGAGDGLEPAPPAWKAIFRLHAHRQ